MISTNKEKCTKCMHCIKVCPADIFYLDKETKQVETHNPERCIECGHCVDACETAAVEHTNFGPDKVHKIDYSLYPSAQQMREIIFARRSNRAFTSKPIPEDSLTAIAEAAYRAPTASNGQEVSFTLVTSPEKLKMLSDFTMETFGLMLRKLDRPILRDIFKKIEPKVSTYIPLFKEMQEDYKNGKDGVLRGATAVLLIHTPKKERFGSIDSNLAYQNASLMAESLGVSQFYTGFLLNATLQRKGKLEQMLGIDGTIHAGMAMAMPSFRMVNYADKNPMKLRRI